MGSCKEQESHEKSGVPVTDAGAYPRAVVVVHLHADAASTAVETAGRSENLAGRTVAELIVLVAATKDVDLFFLVELGRLVLVFLYVIEAIDEGFVALQLV